MKNPMKKRILRELKGDLGKYLVIFLFLVLLIGLVSAFLVADNSVYHAYEEGFEKYNIEDGHLTFDKEPDRILLQTIEEKARVTFYELKYIEETIKNDGSNIRIYQKRDVINQECLMSGNMPMSKTDIALDRMYAQNANLKIGDTIELAGHTLIISGLIALPDYSCLFENNADMMFDSIHFGVAIMTKEGFETMESAHIFYNYGWKYEDVPSTDAAQKDKSDKFLELLGNEIRAYDQALIQTQTDQIIAIKDYLPRYLNKAINFTGEDMGKDKAMFLLFDYIIVVVLAFVFAVTTANTLVEEAGVIGTLRASGYTKWELIRHYMVLPVLVTLLAACIGNLLGYTVLKGIMINMYYNSYSLATYQTLWNAEAFVDTTVIPIILMFVINLAVLTMKMQLGPLQFLRRDLSKRSRKKAIHLNTKLPIMFRFRLRILFQNIPNYLTLFLGIVLASTIVIFSNIFGPLLDDYAELINQSMIADYQYILKKPVEISDFSAEKYCISSLDTTDEHYMVDDVMIYGINKDSSYVHQNIPTDTVLVSNGYMEKYNLHQNDTIVLKDPYGEKTYSFIVGGSYTYDAAIAIFMPIDAYRECFDKNDNYFNGYFSDHLLKNLKEEDIASIITADDMTKVSSQLKVSMGEMMSLLQYFGIVMFLLMMYILSKQIIEKNAQSISMTKILGFKSNEIGRLYILSTSVVVVCSLLVSIPLVRALLHWAFTDYIYVIMTGYIPFIVSSSCYIKMFIMGVCSYGIVSIGQLIKINRIPKSIALKNVE